MKIRFAEVTDEHAIREIHEKEHESSFLLPKPSSRLFTIVAEKENIDAALIVRLVPEATLVMKKNISHKAKVKSLDYLIQAGIMLLRQQNYDNALVFAGQNDFSEVLVKHYGFIKIDADALLLKLE